MQHRVLAVLLAAAVAGTACENSTGVNGAGQVSLSFASSTSTASSIQGDLIASDSVVLGGHKLVLSNADVFFSRIRLKKVETDTIGEDDDRNHRDDEDDDERHEESVRFDTASVSLPLGGGVITPIKAPIPVGDYRSIEMGVSSVRVRGTYDGQAFDVTVPVHLEFKQRFATPVKVASESDKVNVTININTSNWFRNGSTLINPTQTTTSEQLRSIVAKNIRNSVKSLRDHNRDGHED